MSAQPVKQTDPHLSDPSKSAIVKTSALPSGRSVLLRLESATEEIEIRSPAGDVELRIRLTDDGPVVQLSGAKLELNAVDDVNIRCRQFAVEAESAKVAAAGNMRLDAGGDLRIETEKDTHVNGRMIYLNCDDC